MAETIDYLRRRLTISSLGPLLPAGFAAGDSTPSGSRRYSMADLSARQHGDRLRKRGLADVFAADRLAGRRAVCVSSVTDGDGSKRPPFSEKDLEVLHPADADPDELVEWLKGCGFGWCCRKGLKPEAPNQDSYCIIAVEEEFLLTAVLDGHGSRGHDVSQSAMECVVRAFLTHEVRESEPSRALLEAFASTQAHLEGATEPCSPARRLIEAAFSGATCSLVYLDCKLERLIVGHVGDSRCVIGGRASHGDPYETRDLTVDHKPNLPEEKARIESADPPGRVVFDGHCNWRVFAQKAPYPGLNMSRAMGDVVAHEEAGLTAVPDVAQVELAEERRRLSSARGEIGEGGGLALLACSDGVWEFIESEEAFRIASVKRSLSSWSLVSDGAASGQRPAQPTPQESVEVLAGESYKRWLKSSDGEISDDITAVFWRLP